MKRGDYLIHVFIEQARQLKCPDGGTVDPIVECQVLNEKKYTTAKDDIGGGTALCTWNEHLFFEPRNVSVEEIEQTKIQIRVLDKGYFKDSMIGAYEFDVAFIYFMSKHSLLHRWIALSNPECPSFDEVAGYLKLSISVTTKGDEAIQINEDAGEPDKNDQAIMMPPQIKPKYFQIKIRFFRAEKLPMMDYNVLGQATSIDAYLKCKYQNYKLITEPITAKQGQTITWNTEFLLPVQLPVMSGRAIVQLLDQDVLEDEIVGSLLFNFKDCLDSDSNGKFFWKNVYGAPLNRRGAQTNIMNANPEVASTWKGRILIQVVAEETQKPKCISRRIDPDVIKAAEPYYKNREFEIIAEVCSGISLPEKDNYRVMIKIADFTISTDKPLIVDKTYNRWSYRFPQTTYRAAYVDGKNIGNIFVYLMQGDNAVSYYKTSIEEFLDKPNAKLRWVELINDMSVGKIEHAYKAGIVSFKLSIHDKTKNGSIVFEDYEAWKTPPKKRLLTFMSRVYVYQCKDLPSADDDGQSDPYIKVWDQLNDTKTRCVEDNNNPMFFQHLDIKIIEAESLETLPPFVFDIYDKDSISTDDFIGRCIVPLQEASYSHKKEEVPQPKWHSVRTKPGGPKQGEILVSFCIMAADYVFKKPVALKDTVEMKEFQVEINILGLRGLQSVGILPVKKAFVQFNLKSLVSPEEGRAIENIRTQPGPSGANPTLNSLISFKLPLPTSTLFCPQLVCSVYDYIFMGMNQPLIGTFTIPIGHLIKDLQDERLQETKAMQYIIDELDKILKDEGIPTYGIQQLPTERESESFKPVPPQITNPLAHFFVQRLDQAKKRMTVDREMKEPLLLIEEEKSVIEQKPRTSQDLIEMSNQRVLRAPTRKRGPTELLANSISPNNSLVNYPVERKNTKITSAFQIEKFDKFGFGQKSKLLSDYKNEQDRFQRELTDMRLREQEQYKRSGGNVFKNVIMPEYKMDERLKVNREVNVPPDSMYMGLGWDENPESKKRHYRRYYAKELEEVKEVMPVVSPFSSYEIKRGQSRGASNGWWPFGNNQKQDESGEVTNEQCVGKFKGLVTVQSEDDQKAYKDMKTRLVHDLKTKLNQLSLKKTNKVLEMRLDKLATSEGRAKFDVDLEQLGVGHLQVTKHLADLYSEELLSRMLLSSQKCLIRVYVISAFNLSSRDNGSESDPYLILSCGNKIYNDRDLYQENEPNPEFYKCYEFEGQFPGCAPLTIQAMDYDDIFGDDIIGTTQIDLEDRYFSPEWQSIKHKPIEFRSFMHPSSSISQGQLKLWINIIPTVVPLNTVQHFDIRPKPAEDFEVRVVVFDTQDVKALDVEGTSDVYTRVFFESKDAKETDTHYRCTNGKASFNYRLLFNVKHPRKDCNLQVQLYDRDFFKSNDIIGDATLDLRLPLEDCALSKRPLGVTKTYYEAYLKEKLGGAKIEFKDESTFWLPIKQVNQDTGKLEEQGRVRLQINILPKAQAESNKVGEARQEPNHSPFLPPPVGRLSLSLNPFKMLSQLVGPAILRKIYCYACLACVCMLCLAMLPLIFSDLMAALISNVLFK